MSEHYILNSLKIEKQRLKREKTDEKKKSCFQLLITPIDFVLRLTIPSSEQDKWQRTQAAFQPFFSILAFLLLMQMADVTSWKQIAALVASLAAGFFIRNNTFSRRAPPLHIFWVYQVASFFMGMVWIYFLINLVIDLLVLFGIQTGIQASLLGLTILSWGNSIGDAIASAAISRDGFSQMAFTGCISGALLNLLLGLGLTLLFAHRNNSNAGIDFKAVDNEGRATLLIILASICTLLVLLSLIASENWSVRKWHAKIIFGLYFFTVGSAFIIYL